MKRWLFLLPLLLGLLLLSYPSLQQACLRRRQEKIIAAFWAERQDAAGIAPAEDTGEYGKEDTAEAPSLPLAAIAVLEIPKIGLTLPVFSGSGEDALALGAGMMEESAAIGEVGNTILSAHRGYADGRFFRRLDELEAGDAVILTTREAAYRYRVFSNVIVDVNDTSLLSPAADTPLLTLVTCHPPFVKNPPYRLVVQAEIAGNSTD